MNSSGMLLWIFLPKLTLRERREGLCSPARRSLTGISQRAPGWADVPSELVCTEHT